MKSLNLTLTALGLLAALNLAAASEKTAPAPPRIQLAILLDTSNSMDGLINQARTQLWKIVNEFATAERDGQKPRLEVALYEYGNSNLKAGEGYVRQVLPLTDDLDKVSQELFGLTTNGGSEFCGWVIRDSVSGLAWSEDNNDLKTIYICGNEAFTQGGVQYTEACRQAVEHSITVNTVFCGNYQEGVNTKWEHGAKLADGMYMNIDQDRQVASIAAPQDKRLSELNAQLNRTYMGYGRAGAESARRQQAQDALATTAAPAAMAQRAITKANSNLYRNATWDIVDGVREGKVDLEDLDEDALPEPMKKMDAAERKAYVEELAKKRAAIQAEIQTLAAARKQYVAEQMKKQAAADGKETLDQAMVKSLRQQAEKKKFTFE